MSDAAREEEFARSRDPAFRAAVLSAVRSCPDNGGVLPVSLQREGCRCGELSECKARAGPPARPGAVSTEDCVRCQCGLVSLAAKARAAPGR